jgi:threonine 3-dehydrogenase
MVDCMIMGGDIALLGLPSEEIKVDLSQIIFKALNIKAIYGREIYETWYKAIALIESGLDISKIITHTLSYKDFQEGFDLLNAGKAGKVVLNWD